MRIVVPAGGTGGARFVRGLLAALAGPAGSPGSTVTVIGNTGDDLTMWGLRVCPDIDTVLYTLGGGIDDERGWGRLGETFTVKEELSAYAVLPSWFGLGDRDLATHLTRTSLLAGGATLSEATAVLASRWGLPERGVRLLPMSDQPVETHVRLTPPGEATSRLVHFQEYWVRWRAEPAVEGVVSVGAEAASPAPGVLEAIAEADVVLLPPSNPVVSIGSVLSVPGIRDAIRESLAPVVGVSPIVGGRVVRGMADKLLPAIGVEVTAAGVGLAYGPQLLDGWLVDTSDAADVEQVAAAGIACRAVPLLMTDVAATAEIARQALALAQLVER
ncbi:2-phospho-L-lactate transferase [Motilibacter aurantiacus]|uniref:2-phospho-L-lactate transferase n=1 Tax=Motilibacter aurantiacus TaxID=2714955 RepID=UPI00140C24A0|nr:2-phospho-L-lactate transferase [Motilibacter aurantiacus]